MPAFFNGIFGHKPSKFIVSNDGQYPNTTCEEQNSFLCKILQYYLFFLYNLKKILIIFRSNWSNESFCERFETDVENNGRC